MVRGRKGPQEGPPKTGGDQPRAPRADYGWLFRDFGGDLFGRLLPGLLFIVGSILAIAPPVFVLVRRDSTASFIQALLHSAFDVSEVLTPLWLPLLVMVLFLGYAIGHLFYRSEIKKVDRKSFKWISRWGCEDNISDLACASANACEFPYPDLPTYLRKRGFDHLLPLVPWTKEGEGRRRSKKYMDLLRLRIMAEDYGELANGLIHNEAHVRLSSSIWFAARALSWVAAIGIAIIVVVAFSETGVHGFLEELEQPHYIGPLFSPLAVLLVAVFIRQNVVCFLHELRLREALHTLEAAYIVFRKKPEALADIAPEFPAAVKPRANRRRAATRRTARVKR